MIVPRNLDADLYRCLTEMANRVGLLGGQQGFGARSSALIYSDVEPGDTAGDYGDRTISGDLSIEGNLYVTGSIVGDLDRLTSPLSKWELIYSDDATDHTLAFTGGAGHANIISPDGLFEFGGPGTSFLSLGSDATSGYSSWQHSTPYTFATMDYDALLVPLLSGLGCTAQGMLSMFEPGGLATINVGRFDLTGIGIGLVDGFIVQQATGISAAFTILDDAGNDMFTYASWDNTLKLGTGGVVRIQANGATGDLEVDGHSSFGGSSSIGADKVVTIDELFTLTTAEPIGLQVGVGYATGTATTFYAIKGSAYALGTPGGLSNIYGLYFEGWNDSTLAVSNVTGAYCQVFNTNAAGSVGDATGMYGAVGLIGGSITGSAYGVRGAVGNGTLNSIPNVFGGHFAANARCTTGYGIYATAPCDNAATNAYGIYALAEGTNTNNYGIFISAANGTALNRSLFLYAGDAQARDNVTFWFGTDSDIGMYSAAAGVLNFAASVADTDLTFNFIGTTNSGAFTWDEDNAYFHYLDHIFMDGQMRIYFQTTSNYIYGYNISDLYIGCPSNLKLQNDAMYFGSAAGADVSTTWDATANDGVLTWKGVENYFLFSDDILMSTTERLYLRDTAISIWSNNDGYLDFDADVSQRWSIGGTQILLMTGTVFRSTVALTGTVDLGSSTALWKDLWMGGKAYFFDASQYIEAPADTRLLYESGAYHEWQVATALEAWLDADGLHVDDANAILFSAAKGATTNGDWQVTISGADLVVQKREAGAWVTKLTVTA